MVTTDGGLLQRLREQGADAAWTEFFGLYGPAFLRYGRRIGLSAEASQDVLQETMIDLLRVLPEFQYQPERGRFRSFLLTIVHRKACAHWRKESRRPDRTPPCWGPDGTEDPALRAEIDQRWRASLLDAALLELSRDPGVSARDYAAFEAYAVHGRPVADVAAEHGLTEANLYQIKSRLLRRLRARADWLWKYVE